ncbi:hypothetical protein DVH24_031705 [Malus domestica]|uniref:Uncharacterized protein n=1 Tax=Malus domestica TaxID=3750 RepID=A0A498J193_MALDO|nr:hypothetical protein DVH24_031705 [Malus domestica]
MNSEASELPKGIVLIGGANVHIRLTGSSPLGDVGSYNPPPLGARRHRWHTRTTPQSGSDTKLSHPGPGSTPPLHDISGNSDENFPVGHPFWDCSRANLLNFGVPMNSEASKLPKGLVLIGGANVHIRLSRSSPLGDVGSYTSRPRHTTSLLENLHKGF